MLINFQVQNFKSFWKPTNFSMIASSVRRHPSHVAEIGICNVLKSAFIFGANAGGKSNFIKAMEFAKHVIEEGLDNVSCDRIHFRLAPVGQSDNVGVFQFTICVASKFYEYGLAISYSEASIISEWLALLSDEGKQSKLVFSCDWTRESAKIETDFELNENDKTRFDVYREDASVLALHKRTFLAEIATKALRSDADSFFTHFASAFAWFKKFTIVFPESIYGGMVRYVLDEKARLSFGTLLNHFDTGIEKLDTQNVDAEKVFADIPTEKRQILKSQIIANLTRAKKKFAALNGPDNSYLVHYRNGRLTMEKVVANHGRKDDPFDRKDESDGTQRLYDLLPLQRMFSEDTVVAIDELDRSLHTKATLEFIRLFFQHADGHRSQLIATTHDASILDLELLRQDEIWFVDRGDDNASSLFPLTKFKARFDKDIRKDYLLGRYDALPIFRTIFKSAKRE